MLYIQKIFNNNSALVKNELGTEIVVLGKGITFAKKVGDPVDENLIEKRFGLTQNVFTARLLEILTEIPIEYFYLTDYIVRYANKQLGKELTESIYTTLTDHIYHTVQRVHRHQTISNTLAFEIKRLYKAEYTVALHMVEQLIKRFSLEMSEESQESEAAFIALHLFNARTDLDNIQDAYRTTQVIKDILNIVRLNFKQISLNEESIAYSRFLIHLQYFAIRLFQEQIITSNDDFLYRQTQDAYPHAHQCVEKINHYIQRNFDKTLNSDERLYLMIHIQRMVKEENLVVAKSTISL